MKRALVVILILIWFGLHMASQVDLFKSDLGRHIKNGELILKGQTDLLYKNYYAYTNAEYPFINHHWLFGVFCYAVWHYFGFTVLSGAYLFLEILTLYVFFSCWQRKASFVLACAISLLSIPLIASRNEIRPEGISYLFLGLYWWCIELFQQGRLKQIYLIIGLCLLQIIWVNTHIFFIIGPVITALFWLQARINMQKEQANVLLKLFFLLLAMCFINPSGFNGFITPLSVDKGYFEFPIIENYPVLSIIRNKSLSFWPVLVYFVALQMMLMAGLFL